MAESIYSKFVTGFLLEEGAPQFILTDRGREFDNVLLRELMRLLKVRLYLTPSYHPRGNYTERVNRFIGESMRTMLSMPGAKKADWWKLTKFVQFAYRRMFIPGTNLSPYMVARGRQPSLPSDLECLQKGDALPTGAPLSEHVKTLTEQMKLASALLLAARKQQLQRSRESFNQNQIETHFEVGERVRRQTWGFGEMMSSGPAIARSSSSPCDVRDRQSVEVTTTIRDVATGREVPAGISQIARMRSDPVELKTKFSLSLNRSGASSRKACSFSSG